MVLEVISNHKTKQEITEDEELTDDMGGAFPISWTIYQRPYATELSPLLPSQQWDDYREIAFFVPDHSARKHWFSSLTYVSNKFNCEVQY